MTTYTTLDLETIGALSPAFSCGGNSHRIAAAKAALDSLADALLDAADTVADKRKALEAERDRRFPLADWSDPSTFEIDGQGEPWALPKNIAGRHSYRAALDALCDSEEEFEDALMVVEEAAEKMGAWLR